MTPYDYEHPDRPFIHTGGPITGEVIGVVPVVHADLEGVHFRLLERPYFSPRKVIVFA